MGSRRAHSLPAFARHSAGLALAVPEVVAHRVMRMWLAGAPLSARDRDEFQRMYAEKFAAFHESWQAMGLEMFRASVALAFSPPWMTSFATMPARLAASHRQAATRVLSAGLAPIHRRAAANAKRLRRAGR